MKKKQQIVEKEQERLKRRMKQIDSISLDTNDEDDVKEKSSSSARDEEPLERTRVYLDQESEPEEEEDEEIALAKELEKEGGLLVSQNDPEEQETLVNDFTQDPDESLVTGTEKAEHTKSLNEFAEEEAGLSPNNDIDCIEKASEDTLVDDKPDNETLLAGVKSNTDTEEAKETATGNDEDTNDDGEAEFDDSFESQSNEANISSNKPRNAAWKAMLQKEAEILKKQKANRGKSNLLEVEAEEEEEEEGVAGLEDFGFTLQSKKKNEDEDDNVEADEEDFENIVDDVSDNEGDEEAGDAARQAMIRFEEKQRHKDIMRRMREGYDGKRGGIAGGAGGARGNLRFDQLVAADNKDDARRLGLLNEDELDSDDEGDKSNKKGDEVDDEMALLDKVLKDRYLNRTEIPEEEFTDSENEDDEIEEG